MIFKYLLTFVSLCYIALSSFANTSELNNATTVASLEPEIETSIQDANSQENAKTEKNKEEIGEGVEELDALIDSVAVNDSALIGADSIGIKLQVPAHGIYKIWTNDWINPYKIKIDSIPDSTKIDCTNFVYPLNSNRVTSNFGMRGSRYHYGIDLGSPIGDTLRAIFDGMVRIRKYERRGYGHYLVIRHDNGLETISGHLSDVFVEKNQVVKAGDPIGLTGNTGRSTGPHLHFEIRYLGCPFNPNKLIDFTNKNILTEDFLITQKDTYYHNAELKKLSQAAFHTVRSGDTLSRISRRYGVSVTTLCRLNKISTNTTLKIGRKIRYR